MSKIDIGRRTYLLWITLLLGASAFQVQCSATDSGNNSAHSWQTGDIYTDEHGWLEARAGNMPLVISAPHGGTSTPDSIPDRNCQGISTVRDANTTELAFEMEQALIARYNLQPFVIAAHISRRKIDLNRDKAEATCGHEVMEETWYQYHDYIEGAISKAVDEFGWALFIDLHGHGHEIQRLELGYLLNRQDLRDNFYDPERYSLLDEKSSLTNFLNKNQETTLRDLLTGDHAFGTLMEERGIPSVPSLDDPFPRSGEAYFTGGYNTRRYTSADYPAVFGWQIEANRIGIRDTEENRQAFAREFADAIMDFMEQYTDKEPG